MEMIRLTAIGIILGITVAIPGVSTGTIAVVFNVYDRLIEIIAPDIKKIIRSWKFLLPLVAGGVAGIIIISKVISLLFENYPVPTYWFFIGIISGSIPQIYRRVLRPVNSPVSVGEFAGSDAPEKTGQSSPGVRRLPGVPAIISCILAFASMAAMAIVKSIYQDNGGDVLYTVLSPRVFGILAGGGALAAAAMIIPGISGSFLLLVIGLYPTFVQAVSDLNIPLIIPVGIGAIAGVLAGAALVRLLLAKAPAETYGAVLGLVAGSVIVLFPGSLGEGALVAFSAAAALLGAGISFFAGRQKKEKAA